MIRKSLTILLLSCSLTSIAAVPPRDPNRWDEWQRQIALQKEADKQYALHPDMAHMPAATQKSVARTPIPRILVIMANFADFELTSTREDVDSMFNAQNWTKDDAKGSVRQYFYDQSMGEYNPQFDVVGPVTLSQGYVYYGPNGNGTVGCMVTEACRLVDDEVDFSLYDANDDGLVDLVYVLYAGFGRNDPPKVASLLPTISGDLIWPAYWNVASAGFCNNQRVFDGKTVHACEYSNELDGYYCTEDKRVVSGIGIVCHEFSHAIGLPDLYATGDAHYKKLLGGWDIMCNGPYNDDMHSPPSYSAYERFFMGWLTPTLITEPDTLSLEHIATSNQAYLISENDRHNLDGLHPDTAVFYLLENRQKTGWDRGLQGSGMLLTRVNFHEAWWTGKVVNNNPDDLGVDIIEADGNATASIKSTVGYWGKPGDAFPYGATEYTGIPDHAITDITMNDGVITFVYRGGKTATPVYPIMTDDSEPCTRSKAYKIIRNGQLLIHSNGHTYSVMGICQDN